MQPKSLLLALAALTGASAGAVVQREDAVQTQQLIIRNFTIDAITGTATTLYKLSAERTTSNGYEIALCSLKEAQPNQVGTCYNTPSIAGFDQLGCGSTHFTWAVGVTASGLTVQISALGDDNKTKYTACHAVPASQLQCNENKSRKYVGPKEFNITASTNTKC